MRAGFCAFIMGFVFLLATPAGAAPDQAAFSLFVDGAYEEAAAAAVTAGSADDLALAARALNAKAYLQEEDKPARQLAKRALKNAKEAIDLDPALVEAKLQAAISYAQRGSRMSAVRAFLSGNAPKARELLDEALALDPDNAWALSSSGAWHLEVSRRAGEGRFDSDPALGRQQFAAAREADPENLLIAYEAALRLLAYGDVEGRESGLEALGAAISLTPKDAFERSIQARAKTFMATVEKGEEAERAFIEAQP